MNKKNDYKWLILIFVATIILLAELFLNDRIYGHDTLFHTGNIINLSKTISLSNPFGSNLISLSTNPFGYGTWLFYPKLPHLLGAYMYLITKNTYFSMAFVYFITTFLSGIFIYYLSKRIFNIKRVAFLSSIIYLTFSYHICEIYTRDAFAENFMFLVIPMIFLGLYELKENNYNKFYLLFITGYVIGIYSHLISMVFCTIFVAIFLVYHNKYFFNKTKIKPLLISTIIVTGLTIPFLTNILQHKLLGNYIVFTNTFSNKYSTIYNTLNLKSFYIHNKDFIYNNILVYFGYITILLTIVTFIIHLFKSKRKNFKEIRKFLIYASLFIIMFINSEYIWSSIPEIFSTIQFSWRLMAFLCCIISLYAPICFYYKPKKFRKIYYVLYVLSAVIIIVEGVNNIYYYGAKEYSIKEITESTAVMGWQMEYLPVEVSNNYVNYYTEYLIEKKYEFIINNNLANIKIIKDEFPSIKFEVNNLNKATTIEIPRTYYLGYKLYNENNQVIPTYQTKNGFLGTKIDENGIYKLKYEGTIYNKLSIILRSITLISISIWGGFVLWKKRKSQY